MRSLWRGASRSGCQTLASDGGGRGEGIRVLLCAYSQYALRREPIGTGSPPIYHRRRDCTVASGCFPRPLFPAQCALRHFKHRRRDHKIGATNLSRQVKECGVFGWRVLYGPSPKTNNTRR
eukprot:1183719-Prorocentrum_minimum.AAC.15